MTFKIGIDVGGTFTDFLLADERGRAEIYKVLSTPQDPSIGLMNGLEEMARVKEMEVRDFIGAVDTIVHGTTVTTNAVLTRTGAKTALLTTRGVRDTLEMRRGIREKQYDNRFTNVKPLVPRYLRYTANERLDYRGDVLVPLDAGDVRGAAAFFEKENVEAVAICFMNSFSNPTHEKSAAKMVRDVLKDAYLSISVELLPSIRFYDRTSTTVLSAYVGPILERYFANLIRKLKEGGFQGILLIMQSNGGVVSPEVAVRMPAVTLLSGPAGGPVAGIYYTGAMGFSDCITVDMGGTSFDASLIRDRSPLVTTEGEIERLRLALPMLDIVTIGAGGGSIGWIDEGGLLRMGPQSAGANPGPACYDRGGERPTCTDADLLLGYLNRDFFAGGKIKLDENRARRAIREHIAARISLDEVEAAAGMNRVINVNMAGGVREVSVKRGEDPRDFPMVVAGGAGPVHACMIARELEIPVLIVPRESSIFCAAGMLMSDLKHDFVRTCSTRLDSLAGDTLNDLFMDMAGEARTLLDSENIPPGRIEYHYYLDLRYVKQYHEVSVEVSFDDIRSKNIEAIENAFHPEHNRLYGYSLEKIGTPVELINTRLTARGRTEKLDFSYPEPSGEDPSHAFKTQRKIYLPGAGTFREVPVFDGEHLQPGNFIGGPALIEQVNTTTVVTPEYDVLCDRFGSFIVYLRTQEDRIRSGIGL
jgi:N-methylhydantoinase A